MIIKLILFLCFVALAGFFLAAIIGQLLLHGLAEQIIYVSAMLLLGAFCLLLTAGLVQAGRSILTSILDYFSSRQRSERKLLYHLNTYHRLNRLFQLKKDRLEYKYHQQRKRLFRQSNRTSVDS